MADSIISALVTEACLQAGDSSLSNRVTFAFQKWLDSRAATFLWPQCKRTKSAIALAQGIQQLRFGGVGNPITGKLHRVNDPLQIYDSGFSTNREVRIQTDWNNRHGEDISTVRSNPASNRGCPDAAIVRQNSSGTGTDGTNKGIWDVIFNRVADKAYLLEVSYYIIPDNTVLSVPPWYPNDRTCAQACLAEALRYKKDASAPSEFKLLRDMVTQDQMTEGMKPGINDGGIPLDPRYYRK